jgi:hypothetical protein
MSSKSEEHRGAVMGRVVNLPVYVDELRLIGAGLRCAMGTVRGVPGVRATALLARIDAAIAEATR